VSDVASNAAAESGAFTIEPVRSLVVTSVTSASGTNTVVEGQTVHVTWTTTNNIPVSQTSATFATSATSATSATETN